MGPIPRDHPDKKTPMLDTVVWIEPGTGKPGEGDRIRYTYYEEPSTAPLVFHAAGAQPWRIKLQTLAMEVDQRM